MKLKVTTLDKQEINKPEWNLSYGLFAPLPDVSLVTFRVVNFRANCSGEALKRALKILQSSTKRTTKTSPGMITLMPGQFHPLASVDEKNLLRLKLKYENKKAILEMKEGNLKEYFVQGYGPEAAQQLQGT